MDQNVQHCVFLTKEEYTPEEVQRIANDCFMNYYQYVLMNQDSKFLRATIYDTARRTGHHDIWRETFSDQEPVMELFKFLR